MKKLLAKIFTAALLMTGLFQPSVQAITLPPVPPTIAAPYTCVTNYYVATNGNDSNDGTANNSGHAWLTINGAISNLVALGLSQGGTCVNLENGTISSLTNDTNTAALGLTGTGSGSGYLVFRAVNNRQAIINVPWTSATSFYSCFSFAGTTVHPAAWIVIDGVDCEGDAGITDTVSGSPNATVGDVYTDAGGILYTVGATISGGTKLWLIPKGIPAYTLTTSPATTSAGTQYTNADTSGVTQTYTVFSSITSGTSLILTGTGNPNTAHVLTKVANSGNGDATITFSAASNQSGTLTFVSGDAGSSATIAYSAHAQNVDVGVTTPGSNTLDYLSHLVIINSTFNGQGGGGIGVNHTDYLTVEGNIVTNTSSSLTLVHSSGISTYNMWQADNATGYHNIIEWNVLHGNSEGPSSPLFHTDGNDIIIDDSRSTQSKCTSLPTVTITVDGSNHITGGTPSGGTGCSYPTVGGNGEILNVSQSGAYGGQFLISAESGGVPSALTLFTAGTGYTAAGGLATTTKYATSEGQGGTMTITVNGAGGIASCVSSGGAGYINGNKVLITQTNGSSGECQVATNSGGVPSSWTVFNAGKGYTAAGGLAVFNMYDNYTLIQNNLGYNTGGSCIHVFSSDGVSIINNTCYDGYHDTYITQTTGRGMINASNSTSDIFSNNISYAVPFGSGGPSHTTAAGDYSFGSENFGNIWSNNLTYNGTSGQASFYETFTDLSSTTLTGSPYNNYLGVNPAFNNIATFDFTPGSAFPSQDAGISLYGYPTGDLVGTTVNSSVITLGAYQYTTPSQNTIVNYTEYR